MRSNTSIADGTEFRSMNHVITKKASDSLFDYYEVWSAINGYEEGFLRVAYGTTMKELEAILRAAPTQVEQLPEA